MKRKAEYTSSGFYNSPPSFHTNLAHYKFQHSLTRVGQCGARECSASIPHPSRNHQVYRWHRGRICYWVPRSLIRFIPFLTRGNRTSSPSFSKSFVNFPFFFFSYLNNPKSATVSSSQKNRCSWVHLGTAAVWTPGPHQLSPPLTLTLLSTTSPPVLCVFLTFLGRKCSEWHAGDSLILHWVQFPLPALPLGKLIVNADTKKHLQKVQAWSPAQTKVQLLPKGKHHPISVSDTALKFLQARNACPLSSRAEWGPSTRQLMCLSLGYPAATFLSICRNY